MFMPYEFSHISSEGVQLWYNLASCTFSGNPLNPDWSVYFEPLHYGYGISAPTQKVKSTCVVTKDVFAGGSSGFCGFAPFCQSFDEDAFSYDIYLVPSDLFCNPEIYA